MLFTYNYTSCYSLFCYRLVWIYQYEPFRMYISIEDSSTCQCGFVDHSVITSVNKIQIFSLSQVLTAILSRKNSVFAVYLDISCSGSRVLIYLANTVMVNGNQLFYVMWAAHMYCYKQCGEECKLTYRFCFFFSFSQVLTAILSRKK